MQKFLRDIEKEEKNFLKAPIYLYGTEAIGEYYKHLKLKGKSVLTINGSGDQVLNAYYFGAKKVVGFDIVKNTKYMLDLKMAAIKNLSYNEFLDFFGNKKEIGDFDYETYSSLEKYLYEDTNEFFDKLFEQYNYDGKKLLESDNFRKRKEFYEKINEINPFLADKKSYEKMQRIISKVDLEFVESDIMDINKKVKGSFDIINLSNVLNYISKDFVKREVDNPLELIYQSAILSLKKKLKKNGKIIFYRFYRAPKDMSDTPLINQKKSLNWIKKQGDFKVSEIEFKGILSGKDAINVLELR